ncbi:hypothetical protein [Paralysiella testudinis]|uniref:Uncharacterized protein n=1 Tax=Paralysiella testudinis TaxID=2809020 RepID=A0A892ZK93_9NEIS|nr:hypothetical protein [Paralysiella testudinis]QRQ82838.1 hypothetical protein JQU52_05505 [Paralysiella testudinis]
MLPSQAPPTADIVELLLILLAAGWEITPQHERYLRYECDHQDIQESLHFTAEQLCIQLAQFGRLPVEEVRHTAFMPVLRHLQNRFEHMPQNWLLCDWKGRSICTVPNRRIGHELVALLYARGIKTQCVKSDDCDPMPINTRWQKLLPGIQKTGYLRLKIAFYRLDELLQAGRWFL